MGLRCADHRSCYVSGNTNRLWGSCLSFCEHPRSYFCVQEFMWAPAWAFSPCLSDVQEVPTSKSLLACAWTWKLPSDPHSAPWPVFLCGLRHMFLHWSCLSITGVCLTRDLLHWVWTWPVNWVHGFTLALHHHKLVWWPGFTLFAIPGLSCLPCLAIGGRVRLLPCQSRLLTWFLRSSWCLLSPSR